MNGSAPRARLAPVVLRTMRRDFAAFAGPMGAERWGDAEQATFYARRIGQLMEAAGAGEPVDLSAAMDADGHETAGEYVTELVADGIGEALEARDWARIRDLAAVAAEVAEA